MSKPALIYFTGWIGAGKTFCAEYLNRHYHFRSMSEGKRLRDVAQRLYHNTDRDTLQHVGENMRDALETPTFWLDRVLEDIEKDWEICSAHRPTGYTIDDVRHVADADKLNRLGWIGIRVVCKDDIRLERVKARGRDANLYLLDKPSEHYLDKTDFPHQVSNSEARHCTYMQLDAIVEEVLGHAWYLKSEVNEIV